MKILGSEITPYNLYINRRKFIKKVSAVGFVSILPTEIYSKHIGESDDYNMFLDEGDTLNTYEEITNYNNFYEFGMGKSDPAENSKNFNSKPWSIKIEGLVNKPQILDLEKLLSQVSVEDRVYRLRCVEAWSMVIPWQGFSLSQLINLVEPMSSAKFIQFETIFRP